MRYYCSCLTELSFTTSLLLLIVNNKNVWVCLWLMSPSGPPEHPGSRKWMFQGAAESPGLIPALAAPDRQVHLFYTFYCFILKQTSNISSLLLCFADSAVLTLVTFREIWRRSQPSSRCWFSPWRSTQSQCIPRFLTRQLMIIFLL